MTVEVTDRFNGITLFGMALFWQKAIEFFTKFIIHFLTYRVERLFNSEQRNVDNKDKEMLTMKASLNANRKVPSMLSTMAYEVTPLHSKT